MLSEEEQILRERLLTRRTRWERVDSNFLRLQRMFSHLQKFSTKFECSVKMISCLLGNISVGSDSGSESEVLAKLEEGGQLEWRESEMCGDCRVGGHIWEEERVVDLEVNGRRGRKSLLKSSSDSKSSDSRLKDKSKGVRRKKRGRAKSQIDVCGKNKDSKIEERKRGALSQSSRLRKKSRGLSGHGGGSDDYDIWKRGFNKKYKFKNQSYQNSENFQIYRSKNYDLTKNPENKNIRIKKRRRDYFGSRFIDPEGNIYMPKRINPARLRKSAKNEREPRFEIGNQRVWHTSHKQIGTRQKISRQADNDETVDLDRYAQKYKNTIQNYKDHHHKKSENRSKNFEQKELFNSSERQGVIEFKEIGGKRVLTLCNSKKESPKTNRTFNWSEANQNFIIGGIEKINKRGFIGPDSSVKSNEKASWILEEDMGSSSQNIFESQEMMRYRDKTDLDEYGHFESEKSEKPDFMIVGRDILNLSPKIRHDENSEKLKPFAKRKISSRHKNDLYNTDDDDENPDFLKLKPTKAKNENSKQGVISIRQEIFPGKNAFKKSKKDQKTKQFFVGFEDFEKSERMKEIDLKQGIRAGNNSLEKEHDFSKYFTNSEKKNRNKKLDQKDSETPNLRSFWSRENFGFEQRTKNKFPKEGLREKRMRKLKTGGKRLSSLGGKASNPKSQITRKIGIKEDRLGKFRSLTPNPTKIAHKKSLLKKIGSSMTPNPKTGKWPKRPILKQNRSPLKSKLKKQIQQTPKLSKREAEKISKLHQKNKDDGNINIKKQSQKILFLNKSVPLAKSETIYDGRQEEEIQIKLRKEECEKGIRRLSAMDHPQNQLKDLILSTKHSRTNPKRRKSSKSVGEIRRILSSKKTKTSHRVIDFSTPEPERVGRNGYLQFVSKNSDVIPESGSLEGGLDTWGRPSDKNENGLKGVLDGINSELKVNMKGDSKNKFGVNKIKRKETVERDKILNENKTLNHNNQFGNVEIDNLKISQCKNQQFKKFKNHEKYKFKKLKKEFKLNSAENIKNYPQNKKFKQKIASDPNNMIFGDNQTNFKIEKELNKGDTLEFITGDYETEEIESNLMDDTEMAISSKRTSFFGANFLGDTLKEARKNSNSKNNLHQETKKDFTKRISREDEDFEQKSDFAMKLDQKENPEKEKFVEKKEKRRSIELMKIKKSLIGDARDLTEKMKILWPSGEVVFKNKTSNRRSSHQRKITFSENQELKIISEKLSDLSGKGSDSSVGKEKKKSGRIRRISHQRLSKSYNEGFKIRSKERGDSDTPVESLNQRNKGVMNREFSFLNKSVGHSHNNSQKALGAKNSQEKTSQNNFYVSENISEKPQKQIFADTKSSEKIRDRLKNLTEKKLSNRDFQVGKLHVRGSSWSGSESESHLQTFGAEGKRFDFVNEDHLKKNSYNNKNLKRDCVEKFKNKKGEISDKVGGEDFFVGNLENKVGQKQIDMEVITEESEEKEGNGRNSLKKQNLVNLFENKEFEIKKRISLKENVDILADSESNKEKQDFSGTVSKNQHIEKRSTKMKENSVSNRKNSFEKLMDDNLVKHGTYESEILESDGHKFASGPSREKNYETEHGLKRDLTSKSNTLRVKTGTTENDEITFESSANTTQNRLTSHSEKNFSNYQSVSNQIAKQENLDSEKAFDFDESDKLGDGDGIKKSERDELGKESLIFLHSLKSKEIPEHEFQDNLKSLISDQNIRNFKTGQNDFQTQPKSHFGRKDMIVDNLERNDQKISRSGKNLEIIGSENRKIQTELKNGELEEEDSIKGELKESETERNSNGERRNSNNTNSEEGSQNLSEGHFVSDYKPGYTHNNLENEDSTPIFHSITKKKRKSWRKFKKSKTKKESNKKFSQSEMRKKQNKIMIDNNYPEIKSTRLLKNKRNMRYAVAGLSGDSDKKLKRSSASKQKNLKSKSKRSHKRSSHSEEDNKIVQMILDNNEKMNQTVLQQVLEQGQRSASMLRDCFKDVLEQNQQMSLIWRDKENEIQTLRKELEIMRLRLSQSEKLRKTGMSEVGSEIVMVEDLKIPDGSNFETRKRLTDTDNFAIKNDPVYEFSKKNKTEIIQEGETRYAKIRQTDQSEISELRNNFGLESDVRISSSLPVHNSQEMEEIHVSRTTLQKYENEAVAAEGQRAQSCYFLPSPQIDSRALFNTLQKDSRYQNNRRHAQTSEEKESVFTDQLTTTNPKRDQNEDFEKLEKENARLRALLQKKERSIAEMEKKIKLIEDTRTRKNEIRKQNVMTQTHDIKSERSHSAFLKMSHLENDEPESYLYTQGKRLKRSKRSLDLKNSAEKEETLNFQTFDKKAKGNEKLFADLIVENDDVKITQKAKSMEGHDECLINSKKNVFLNSESINESLKGEFVVVQTGSFGLIGGKSVRDIQTQTENDSFNLLCRENTESKNRDEKKNILGGMNSNSKQEEQEIENENNLEIQKEERTETEIISQSSLDLGIKTNDVLKYLLCQAMCIDSGLDAYEESEQNSQETLLHQNPHTKSMSSESDNLMSGEDYQEYQEYGQDLKIKVQDASSSDENLEDLSMSHHKTKLSQISEITERSETSPASEKVGIGFSTGNSNRNFGSFNDEGHPIAEDLRFGSSKISGSASSFHEKANFAKKLDAVSHDKIDINQKNKEREGFMKDYGKFGSKEIPESDLGLNTDYKKHRAITTEEEKQEDLLIDSYDNSETEKEGTEFMKSSMVKVNSHPIRDLLLDSLGKIKSDPDIKNSEKSFQKNSSKKITTVKKESETISLKKEKKITTPRSNFVSIMGQTPTNQSQMTKTQDSQSIWHVIQSSKNEMESLETILTKEENVRHKKVNSSNFQHSEKLKKANLHSQFAEKIQSDQQIQIPKSDFEDVKNDENKTQEKEENEIENVSNSKIKFSDLIEKKDSRENMKIKKQNYVEQEPKERSNNSNQNFTESIQSDQKSVAKVYLQNLVTNLENSDGEQNETSFERSKEIQNFSSQLRKSGEIEIRITSEKSSKGEIKNKVRNKKIGKKQMGKKWGNFLMAMKVPDDPAEELEFLGTQSFKKEDEKSQKSQTQNSNLRKNSELEVNNRIKKELFQTYDNAKANQNYESELSNLEVEKRLVKSSSRGIERVSENLTEMGTYETERGTSDWSQRFVKDGELNFENMYLKDVESEKREIDEPVEKSVSVKKKLVKELNIEKEKVNHSKSKIENLKIDLFESSKNEEKKTKPQIKPKEKATKSKLEESPKRRKLHRQFSLQTKSRFIFGVDKMNHLRESDPIFKRSTSHPETSYFEMNKQKLKKTDPQSNKAGAKTLKNRGNLLRKSGRSSRSRKSNGNSEKSYRSLKSSSSNKSHNKKNIKKVVGSYSKIFKQRIQRMASKESQAPKKNLERKISLKMGKEKKKAIPILKSKLKKETRKEKKLFNQKSKKKSEIFNLKNLLPKKKSEVTESELTDSGPQISDNFDPSQFHYPKKNSQSNLSISIHRKNSFPETMGKVPSPVNSETSNENIYRNRSLQRLERLARGRLQTNEISGSTGENLNIYKKQSKKGDSENETHDWEVIDSEPSYAQKSGRLLNPRGKTIYDYQNEPTPKNSAEKVITLTFTSTGKESQHTLRGKQQGNCINKDLLADNEKNSLVLDMLRNMVKSEEEELPIDSQEILREADLSKRTLKKSETKQNWGEQSRSRMLSSHQNERSRKRIEGMKKVENLLQSENLGQFSTFDFGDRRPLRSQNWDRKSSTMERELEKDDL